MCSGCDLNIACAEDVERYVKRSRHHIPGAVHHHRDYMHSDKPDMLQLSQELAGWHFTCRDIDKMHRMFETCQNKSMSTDTVGMMRLLRDTLNIERGAEMSMDPAATLRCHAHMEVGYHGYRPG